MRRRRAIVFLRVHRISWWLRHEVARLIVWQVVSTRPVVPSTVSYEVRQHGNALANALRQRPHSHVTGTCTAKDRCLCQHQAEMGLEGWDGAHRGTLDKRRQNRHAKDAERLEPKGTVAGTEVLPSPVMARQRSRRLERTSPMRVNRVERGKPVAFLSPDREGSRQADPWRCGYGGGKKRRPSCNGTETGCHITRRASAPTALRCLGTRTT